ncbi:hypothetical protein D3C71_2031690 [compost metagenome]
MVQRVFKQRLQHEPRDGIVQHHVVHVNPDIKCKIIADLLQSQILLDGVDFLADAGILPSFAQIVI